MPLDLSVVDGNRPRPLPMLLGHEAAGVVVGVGDAAGDIRPGQRVVMSFLPRCDECPDCAEGGRLPCPTGSAANAAGTLLAGLRLSAAGRPVHHHLGVSGFATHAVVDRASVVPVGSDIRPTSPRCSAAPYSPAVVRSSTSPGPRRPTA